MYGMLGYLRVLCVFPKTNNIFLHGINPAPTNKERDTSTSKKCSAKHALFLRRTINKSAARIKLCLQVFS
jgi:hypothetical protein